MVARVDYTGIAKLLHWLIAAFVVGLVALGLLMTEEKNLTTKFQLYQLHKSFGITVLGLMGLRIAWRVFNPPPPLPGSVPPLERAAANGGHLGLYLLLLALPVSGWAMVSAATAFAVPTVLYGAVPWPHIGPIAALPMAEKKTVEAIATETHEILGWVLIGLVAIHVLAALRHGFIKRDGVLARMWPRLLGGGVAALLLVVLPQQAHAQSWQLDVAKSKIGFAASVAGAPVAGSFKGLTAEIVFDPAAPEAAKIRAVVAIAGVTTGTKEADAALPGADMFDAAKFPEAVYEAAGAKPLGGGRYELAGTLTLKGKAAPVPLTFTLIEGGAAATAKGEAKLNRQQFGVGPKDAIAGMVIADEVTVTIDIVASRAP